MNWIYFSLSKVGTGISFNWEVWYSATTIGRSFQTSCEAQQNDTNRRAQPYLINFVGWHDRVQKHMTKGHSCFIRQRSMDWNISKFKVILHKGFHLCAWLDIKLCLIDISHTHLLVLLQRVWHYPAIIIKEHEETERDRTRMWKGLEKKHILSVLHN